jgi:preprotein translocase subunit SecF
VQVTVGSSSGFNFGPSEGIDETGALILMEVTDPDTKDALVPIVREQAELIFNDLNNNGVLDYEENGEDGENAASNVSVSGADLAGGDFGGFALEVRAADPENQPSLAELRAYNETVLTTLNNVEGLVNVELENDFGDGTDSPVYIRIDGETALRYIAEVESEDTLGITAIAIEEVQAAVDELADSGDDLNVPIEIAQGFESQQQEEGVAEIFVSMIIASAIAIVLLAVTFRHIIIPFEIFVSLPLSFLGAGIALTLTNRVLGLPALVGLLMLIGIVLTNAIVLLDRVQQNRREKHMSTYDALVEAGETRLRPILMTAATTAIAQLPLAASSESGAIIAAELATVVIGGLVSSTLLTLIVLPVIFSLVHGFLAWFSDLIGMGGGPSAQASAAD